MARLPTIRRHKSQTIQTPGPDGSTLAKPPSSSRASTRYTRTIRDINTSVENLGKFSRRFACSFDSIFALMMLSFVGDCLSSCYEVPIPFHLLHLFLFAHTHTQTFSSLTHRQIILITTKKRGEQREKTKKQYQVIVLYLSWPLCMLPIKLDFHPKQSVQNSLLYINRNISYA